jgi:predicted component of type VI protein secretion system
MLPTVFRMRVTIRNVFGTGIEQDVAVTAPGLLIGRSLGCGLRPACLTVSRVHCELIVRDGYVAVRDLNSRNGTFVNSDRVSGERQLLSGDRLCLGECAFEVVIDFGREVAFDGQLSAAAERPREFVPVGPRAEGLLGRLSSYGALHG